MTLTIDLTQEEEARLRAAAQKEGLAPAELARKLVTQHLLPVRTEAATPLGARILAELEQEGALGIWQDRPEESGELARAWRKQAETRGRGA